MDGYLDRLKNFQKRPTTLPTKPTKPDFGGFEGFVGTPPRGSQDFSPPPDTPADRGSVGFVGTPPRGSQDFSPDDLRHAPAPGTDHQAGFGELTEERAAILEHDGGFSRAEAEQIARGVHADFIGHLMQQETSRCGCRTRAWTAARVAYCPEGQRLRDEYHAAAERRDT